MNFDVQIFDKHKQKAIKEFNDWHSAIQLSKTNNPKIIRTCIEHLLYALVVKNFGITEFNESSYNILKNKGLFSYPFRSFNASTCLFLLTKKSLLSNDLNNIAKQLIEKGNKDIHELIAQNPDKNAFIQFVDWFFSESCSEKKWKEDYITPHMDALKRNLVQEIGQELSKGINQPIAERKTLVTELPILKGSYIDALFWEKLKITNPEEIITELKYFYINPASSYGGMIEKTVANNFYILPNENLEIEQLSPRKNKYKDIDELFFEFENKLEFKCLIKVTGLGGSGKTTFLWHLAKQYCEEYKTFFLDSFDKDSLHTISKSVEEDESILILLDNVYEESKHVNLKDFFKSFNNLKKVIFVISERSNWLEHLEDKFSLYSHFLYVYEVPFTNCLNRTKVFSKLLSLLPTDNNSEPTIPNSYTDTAKLLEADVNLSLVESKYLLLKKIKQDFSSFKFTFDWEDWEDFTSTNTKFSSLNNLYLFISAFQHLGQKVPSNLNFNKIFESQDINYFLINEAISVFSSEKSPILIDETFIYTRHDMLGEILMNNLTVQQKNALKRLLKNYFSNIVDTESIYLFRNIHRNRGFRASEIFSDFLTYDNRVRILNDYLSSIPAENYGTNEFKCLTELIKTYEELGDKEKMHKTISTLIDFEKELNTNFGQHMLANFIIDFDITEKFKEAETILTEINKTNSRIVHSSFIKLYSKYNSDEIPESWKRQVTETSLTASDEVRIEMARAQMLLKEGEIEDAIDSYKNIIKTYPKDFHSRTKLSSVLRKQANKAFKAKDFRTAKQLLNSAREHLLTALELNPKNEHTYTELGETLFDLRDTDGAIFYLQQGIANCKNSIGCKTSLGKIYRNIAKLLAKQNRYEEVEKNLTTSYEILKQCKIDFPNHQPSSIELSETCMKYYHLYKTQLIDNTKAEFFKKEIETVLYPLFLNEDRKIKYKEKAVYGLRLLLSFYKKNDFITEYDKLAVEILNSTDPDTEFWFSLLDIFEEPLYIQQLFSKLIQSEINDETIHKIVNKLTNVNYRISNISEAIQNVISSLKEKPIIFRNGTLLLGVYYYTIGDLEKCKGVLTAFSKRIDKDQSLLIWQEFIKLISDKRLYINLSIQYDASLEISDFYFKEAQRIKQIASNTFTGGEGNSLEIGKQIGHLKHQLHWQFGVTKLKSLNKFHELKFGFGCFYIYLALGELYQRKRLQAISDEYRYKIAKANYEFAYQLGIQNKFSYLESSDKINRQETKVEVLQNNYFERLINNMIDCYLNLHLINEADIFIERSLRIINHNRIQYNKPFYQLLLSKIFTRQKKYTEAYNVCQIGLNFFKDYALYNPEIYQNSEGLKGALCFNLAYAAHKNWKENSVWIGNKNLKSIRDIYQIAYNLYPKNWILKKLKEVEEELK